MKSLNGISFFLLVLLAQGCRTNESQAFQRNTLEFNKDWQFIHQISSGDMPKASDTQWMDVAVPHDWSVTFPFSQENTAGATAFLPGGIGWYQKVFEVPLDWKGKITWIEFDGVYNNAEVWVNGNYLGSRPYGYSPFNYDLTEHLIYGKENRIVVKADRSAYIDCRWYPGSGIYRNVKLVVADKLHIPKWGQFITTPKITDTDATIHFKTHLKNKHNTPKQVEAITTIWQDDKKIASSSISNQIGPEETNILEYDIEVDNPNLWDIDSPHLYGAVTEIFTDDQLVDTQKVQFGIRHFQFDRKNGFSLNGKQRLIKGVCLHHDGGLVGAAVPKDVWRRRLQKLKAAGCNAIRTAHNPPSEEFLDLCDEMGFLVQDEAFDEWENPKDKRHNYNQQEANPLTQGYTEHFLEWSKQDVQSMVLRDRNHPSVFMWSIGNEIEWTYPRYGKSTGYWGENKVGDVDYYWDVPPFTQEEIMKNFARYDSGGPELAKTSKNLSEWVRQIDTTRPVTANLVIPSVSGFTGYAEDLDVVGLSYRQSVYKYMYDKYPGMIFLGTENWTRYHEWKKVLDGNYVSGIFLWTGINYMGESREWPKRGSSSGLLDFAGFEKPSYHMFKSLWSDEPHIYMNTQTLGKSPYKWDSSTSKAIEKEANWAARQKWGWQDVNEHWNYKPKDSIAVEVYTNQPEVELFINEKSVGNRKLVDVDDHILKWVVPYEEGTLTARSGTNKHLETSLKSAGKFSGIQLTIDKTKITANTKDAIHIVAQLTDETGNLITHEEQCIKFMIDGYIRLLGVDNGWAYSLQKYQNDAITTHQGKALLILQAKDVANMVKVEAYVGKVKSNTLEIAVE